MFSILFLYPWLISWVKDTSQEKKYYRREKVKEYLDSLCDSVTQLKKKVTESVNKIQSPSLSSFQAADSVTQPTQLEKRSRESRIDILAVHLLAAVILQYHLSWAVSIVLASVIR